jgi:hypothetical protein
VGAGIREDYRFTGKEEDVEVGLTYFGKRYYAPLLGRWVSADPLGIDSPFAEPGLRRRARHRCSILLRKATRRTFMR